MINARVGILPVSFGQEVYPIFHEHNKPMVYEMGPTQYTSIALDEIIGKRVPNNDGLLHLTGALPPGAIIAGGYVTSTIGGTQLATDIDIFFTGSDAFKSTYNLIQDAQRDPESNPALYGYSTKTPLESTFKLSNDIRFIKFTHPSPDRLPIQLIKMYWFSNAQHVIDSFDFTVCQFAIESNMLVYNPLSMIDLFTKKLQIHKSQTPGMMLRRLIKYTNKGYFASPNVLLEIAESIKKCNESDPDYFNGVY